MKTVTLNKQDVLNRHVSLFKIVIFWLGYSSIAELWLGLCKPRSPITSTAKNKKQKKKLLNSVGKVTILQKHQPTKGSVHMCTLECLPYCFGEFNHRGTCIKRNNSARAMFSGVCLTPSSGEEEVQGKFPNHFD